MDITPSARPRYIDTPRACCVVRTEPPNAFWHPVRDATGTPDRARSFRARHHRVVPRGDGAFRARMGRSRWRCELARSQRRFIISNLGPPARPPLAASHHALHYEQVLTVRDRTSITRSTSPYGQHHYSATLAHIRVHLRYILITTPSHYSISAAPIYAPSRWNLILYLCSKTARNCLSSGLQCASSLILNSII